MRDDHIIDLLDRSAIGALGEDERARVEAHAAGCPSCRRAYLAARVSAEMLAARAGVAIEPPPFFHTRVMSALRERQAATEGSSLSRMWRAAGSLVSAMATFVLLLGGAAYVSSQPDARQEAPEVVAGQALYSPEWELLEEPEAAEVSYDQLLTMIYDSEDVYGQGR